MGATLLLPPRLSLKAQSLVRRQAEATRGRKSASSEDGPLCGPTLLYRDVTCPFQAEGHPRCATGQQQAISFPWSMGVWEAATHLEGGTFHKESHLRKIYCSEAPSEGSTHTLKAGPFPLQQTLPLSRCFDRDINVRHTDLWRLSDSSVSLHACALGFVGRSLNALRFLVCSRRSLGRFALRVLL